MGTPRISDHHQAVREEPMGLPDWSAWLRRAACRKVPLDLFFPSGGSDRREENEARAKTICSVCPVRIPCLTFALAHDEAYGVWGGLTAEERRARATNPPVMAKAVDGSAPLAGRHPGNAG